MRSATLDMKQVMIIQVGRTDIGSTYKFISLYILDVFVHDRNFNIPRHDDSKTPRTQANSSYIFIANYNWKSCAILEYLPNIIGYPARSFTSYNWKSSAIFENYQL